MSSEDHWRPCGSLEAIWVHIQRLAHWIGQSKTGAPGKHLVWSCKAIHANSCCSLDAESRTEHVSAGERVELDSNEVILLVRGHGIFLVAPQRIQRIGRSEETTSLDPSWRVA